MKKLITAVFLICAAAVLFYPLAGNAFNSWDNGGQGGCKTCHPAAVGSGLHTQAAHSNCAGCHEGGVPGKNVPPSACIVCHPTGDPGTCPLIEQPTHGTSCLSCHNECAPTSTTTTTPAGPCPAEAVLGEDDPRLDTLRAFRDQVLASNPNGQKMIKMYYDASAAIVQMMDNDPKLRESARNYLESIMPTIEMMVKQKAKK